MNTSELEMIVDLIKIFQPDSSVTVYKGLIYVNGEPINKRH